MAFNLFLRFLDTPLDSSFWVSRLKVLLDIDGETALSPGLMMSSSKTCAWYTFIYYGSEVLILLTTQANRHQPLTPRTSHAKHMTTNGFRGNRPSRLLMKMRGCEDFCLFSHWTPQEETKKKGVFQEVSELLLPLNLKKLRILQNKDDHGTKWQIYLFIFHFIGWSN